MTGRWLAYVALALLATLFIGYGVAEAALRFSIHPPPNPFPYLWVPKLRQRVSVNQPVPGLQPQETTFTTNSLGIRGDELNIDEDADVTKIMVLGGSVTECLLVDDQDAWPHVAQELLREATEKEIWVGNAGQSGQNTLDYVAHAQVLLPEIRPDIVVVMPGGNDLQAAVEERLLPLDLIEDKALLKRFATKLYQPGASRVFDEMEPSFTWFLIKQHRTTPTLEFSDFYRRVKSARYGSPKQDEIADLADHLETYRANLKQLVEAVSTNEGTQLVLMTHPSLWKDQMPDEEVRALWAGYSCMGCPDPVFYSRRALRLALEEMNAITLQVCEEADLECFDLAPNLEKNLENFYDDAHLTTQGSRRVGRMVADFLVTQEVVQ